MPRAGTASVDLTGLSPWSSASPKETEPSIALHNIAVMAWQEKEEIDKDRGQYR